MAEKITRTITRAELPDFLRNLADACETEPVEGIPNCTNAKKIRLSVKDEYGQLTVKLKINASIDECDRCEECECGGTRPDGLPRYKRLKKRMGTSFKVIFKALHQHATPPEEAVRDFIADSRLMTKYPGKGDPLYAEYDKLTDALEQAWQANDMQKFHETVDAMNHMKTECHHKYK
ncbi:GAK system XXXCH domain-containing protein [Halodesulfovibrio sp.]|jgi:XXXCH domain-containing protein|uniref:GAK system XXXCH domain-containing protein n=1 Tax=Halodesulfovibrio sp. TaxID=1912772 RepID=UPI0025E47EFF|nr:GAK system XXXCH domain-containing protein [Halodesulfovibrio sp.]MCT4535724.1 GAK system XXXCH domain-containing protein [Halodesulfovibrio sp.]MCT4627364.1 GAK system XXXCH domain-containing protein [Halodesulfovibrio sp.]